ncbi:hypothetical protein D3C87_1775580 [compost metagenome]
MAGSGPEIFHATPQGDHQVVQGDGFDDGHIQLVAGAGHDVHMGHGKTSSERKPQKRELRITGARRRACDR